MVGADDIGVHHVLNDLVAGLIEFGQFASRAPLRCLVAVGHDVGEGQARIVDKTVHCPKGIEGLRYDAVAVFRLADIGCYAMKLSGVTSTGSFQISKVVGDMGGSKDVGAGFGKGFRHCAPKPAPGTGNDHVSSC